jgi:hypothetical protein
MRIEDVVSATSVSCARQKIQALPLFEIALVLVRLDHVARFIVNANHGSM